MNIVDAINHPRYHHQLEPNILKVEEMFLRNNNLRKWGYEKIYEEVRYKNLSKYFK